jgi:hypothetical protein
VALPFFIQHSSFCIHSLQCRLGSEAEIDVALLEDSLEKTPWERMQANDDALRFADSLRDALEKRNAGP